MSRSYKKTPITTDHGRSTSISKRWANKKVRNTEDVQNGGSFKKAFCSYDICDWKFGEYSWEETWEEINKSEENMKYFYENVLGIPYTKKEKNKKELMREFHKRIGK